MALFRVLVRPAILAATLVVPLCSADAAVLVRIDKSSQQMSVVVDGATRYSWPVSTGRAGFGTPSGTYSPQRLERSHFSRKYYNSPMPYSIFFHGGYAIHGSYEIARLGGPASHGCVRLHPSNAATLFSLVKQHGAGNTRIVVAGGSPAGVARAPRVAPEAAPEVSYQPRAVYPSDPYQTPYYRPFQPFAPRTYPGGQGFYQDRW
ncbi:MAG: L,D-transpeptidase [Rhodoplanes sp.]|uniref:L,D-transpeptidase n=1 Tax=Rhodoplanes sp. TaxID=1968906 RepID=UPI0017B380DF|nr:L,D-transpeptidase [Rhodoplanes sp.]NVO12644.1 L,D-transpeptidase [Rhodoplanes sp.]